ncbi:MAG: MFS transporter [Lachnospiraceae bacterium]
MSNSSTNQKNALTKKNVIGYALGDLGGCMTFAVIGSFLTPYYTEVAGLSTSAVAIMLIVLKIWDAINAPVIGMLMDKAFSKGNNKNGKFRPWMRRATPLLFITALLMYTAPTYVNGAAKVVVAFVTYLLYEVSYTLFNIPYGSLLAVMANTDEERARLSSSRGFGSMIGNLIPLFMFPIIIDKMTANPQLGYTAGITVCAVIGFIACMLSFRYTVEQEASTNGGSNEIKLTDIFVVFRKNPAFVALCIQGFAYCMMQYVSSTLGVYMYRDVLGALSFMSISTLLNMGLSCIVLAIVPKIVGKFGLEQTVRGSQLISVLCYAVLFFLPNNVFIYLIGSAVASGFSGITVFMQWGMVGQAIDYNEFATGKRTEGSIYGTFNLMRRVGQAVGTSGSVALLGVIGYVPGLASQASGVETGIKALVLLVPAVCMFICFLALKYVWNITPEVREKLHAFKENN